MYKIPLNNQTAADIYYIQFESLFPFTENMASSQRWDKLSPTEFQQLQDLASCEY